MNYLRVLRYMAAGNGGIIETKTAGQRGISRSLLSKMCQAGKLQRIARGQYILPEELPDEREAER